MIAWTAGDYDHPHTTGGKELVVLALHDGEALSPRFTNQLSNFFVQGVTPPSFVLSRAAV